MENLNSIFKKHIGRRSFLTFAASFSSLAFFRTAMAQQIPFPYVTPENIPEMIEGIAQDLSLNIQLAKHYSAALVIKWGEAITGTAPDIDFYNQSRFSQEKQFGFNNDSIAFLSLPYGSGNSDNGLLCINHSSASPHMMLPSYFQDQNAIETLLSAQGHSVIEVKRISGRWEVVKDSTYNRRITGLTPINISGPAKKSLRLKTSYDQENKAIIGTLNNSSGSKTPWGTILMAEQDFDKYFRGNPDKTNQAEHHNRYGVGNENPAYGAFIERFDIEKEPNEPNRFGWVVEFDPYSPSSVPVKRTALGRLKHVSCAIAICPDNRVAVYSGDNQEGGYLYKFVSHKKFNPQEREKNFDLLEKGTLYAAQFKDQKNLFWLPLEYGQGLLTKQNGFESQADVLIEARRAADMVGATKIECPKNIALNMQSYNIFISLIINPIKHYLNTGYPKFANPYGCMINLLPPNIDHLPDHSASHYEWERVKQVEEIGFSIPDNMVFGENGKMWITTAGQFTNMGKSESIYMASPFPYKMKNFMNVPRGADIPAIELTPDNTTMFVAIRHPGEEPGSSFTKPTTHWPDFKANTPPRSAIIAITRNDNGKL